MSYLEIALRVEERIRARKSAETREKSGKRGNPFDSPEVRDYVERFGRPEARLYPFLNTRVHTPAGAGVLLQVVGGAVVLLDGEQQTRRFPWDQVVPEVRR